MIYYYEPIYARFIERKKRFFAHMLLNDGIEVIAHCPNPGKMIGLLEPGTLCILSSTPHCKLKYKWQIAFIEDTWVGVNTMIPNTILEYNISHHLIAQTQLYPQYKREFQIGHHRIDFMLYNSEHRSLIEVKNVHWKREGSTAYFPDCVTERGKKHMDLLAGIGNDFLHRTIIFLIQRDDCTSLKIASDIDPQFYKSLCNAVDRGVKIEAYTMRLEPGKTCLGHLIPFLL